MLFCHNLVLLFQMQSALLGLFSVRCPSRFTTAINGYAQSFESGFDAADTEAAPFCGRSSLKNQQKIYPFGLEGNRRIQDKFVSVKEITS